MKSLGVKRRQFLTSLGAAPLLAAGEDYPLGPDSQRQPGVPVGKVIQQASWKSTVFPGTVRDWWIYVPAQYEATKPACLIVIQDGGGWVKEDGAIRMPVVMDNLIHRGEMPVTIGVFVNPGVLPAPAESAQARYNRSYEYDAVNDRYATFLIDELLPEVRKQYNVSNDADHHAIGGSSSGASCAFTAAWQRPDQFRRVLSWIGSYTNLRGAEMYPDRIRKTEPKPLRVFLQDGKQDNNIYAGSWYIANQDMAAALEFSGYDVKFVVGEEAHNSKHGSIDPSGLAALVVARLSEAGGQTGGRESATGGDGDSRSQVRVGGGERGASIHRRADGRWRRKRVLLRRAGEPNPPRGHAERRGVGVSRGCRRNQRAEVRR